MTWRILEESNIAPSIKTLKILLNSMSVSYDVLYADMNEFLIRLVRDQSNEMVTRVILSDQFPLTRVFRIVENLCNPSVIVISDDILPRSSPKHPV